MPQSTLLSPSLTASKLHLVPQPPQKTLYKYVLVVGSLEQEEFYNFDGTAYQVPAQVETLFPVFDHEPTQSDWDEFLAGWRKADFIVLSSPSRLEKNEEGEF